MDSFIQIERPYIIQEVCHYLSAEKPEPNPQRSLFARNNTNFASRNRSVLIIVSEINLRMDKGFGVERFETL